MNYIEPLDRYQYQLMSCLDDLVSSNHPVRIIDKIVESDNIQKGKMKNDLDLKLFAQFTKKNEEEKSYIICWERFLPTK